MIVLRTQSNLPNEFTKVRKFIFFKEQSKMNKKTPKNLKGQYYVYKYALPCEIFFYIKTQNE